MRIPVQGHSRRACPWRSATVRMSTPAAIRVVTEKWRLSWNRNGHCSTAAGCGSPWASSSGAALGRAPPCVRQSFPNRWVRVSGFTGTSPIGVVRQNEGIRHQRRLCPLRQVDHVGPPSLEHLHGQRIQGERFPGLVGLRRPGVCSRWRQSATGRCGDAGHRGRRRTSWRATSSPRRAPVSAAGRWP